MMSEHDSVCEVLAVGCAPGQHGLTRSPGLQATNQHEPHGMNNYNDQSGDGNAMSSGSKISKGSSNRSSADNSKWNSNNNSIDSNPEGSIRSNLDNHHQSGSNSRVDSNPGR